LFHQEKKVEIGTVLDNAILRLRVSRRDASRELQAQLKIGQAIRSQRIRDMRDLDEARREKQEWTQRTVELLEHLVTSDAWVEQFNDYTPNILPEYAEFGMFVEVFEEEMRIRLGKLQVLAKTLKDLPEPGSAQPTTAAQTTHPEVEVPNVPAEEIMIQQAIPTNPLAEPDPPRMSASSSVHGALIVRMQDDALRQNVAQFMQKMGITLHLIDRQAPGATSMLELLSAQRSLNFAMVLVDANNGTASSPDDLFDLGCCVGRLGPGRVYAIHRGGEGSVDRHGISHIPVDSTEGWQLNVARLLKKAGVAVDLNKLV
jgi:hypothetical protein